MPDLRYLLDEHVSHAVAEGLRRRGIDVLTAVEAGLRGASDIEYLRRSHIEGRIVVTQDRDFLRLHRQGLPHAGIAYCDQGSRSVGQMITALVTLADTLDPGDMMGQVQFL